MEYTLCDIWDSQWYIRRLVDILMKHLYDIGLPCGE